TNYRPNVNDQILFKSKRIKVIPFNRCFAEDEQDHGLKEFFSDEKNLSGIFNWCLEGCRKFYAEGMKEPEAVIEAVREYQVESDRIGQFIEAWIEKGEAYEVLSSAVFRRYTEWCKEYNYNAENVKNFKTAMAQHFTYVRRKPKAGGEKTTLLIGCKLRDEELGAESPDTAALANDFVPLDEPQTT
ncbi:MAG: hypothetical protein IJ906_12830, partial [Oscillospiraceae bacterium]|nr:hypothetical protein [Oscillospiraceae bacterium]